MPKLVVLSEGFTGRTQELKGEKISIGRVEDNTFQLTEPSISSHHCEVSLQGSDVLIKDLGSTNGTYINGEKISESTLKPGQILRLGQVELRLEGDSTPAAAAAKKKLDQTRVIPQGVKLNEFEQGAQRAKFEASSPFAKKTNKANLVFIGVGVVLAVVIVVFLVIAFLKMKG